MFDHLSLPAELLEQCFHPWAKDPQTIGALAATQIAIQVYKGLDETSHLENQVTAPVQHKVRAAGAIEYLVEYIKSDQEDRVHAGAIALSFISTECPENCRRIYQLDGLQVSGVTVDTISLLACRFRPIPAD